MNSLSRDMNVNRQIVDTDIYILVFLDYQKVLIGVSFACVFISLIALLLSQVIQTHASFHDLQFSKRMIECLLIANILSGRL